MPKGLQGFQKGHKDFVPKKSRKIASFKISKALSGKRKSKEARQRMSEIRKGKPTWWMKKGLPNPMQGKKMSENINHKLAMEKFRGENNPMFGKKLTKEQKLKISQSLLGKSGDKARNWRGGITPLNIIIRSSNRYKNWRISVFQRDNFTCQVCGKKGGTLHAHHIKPFSIYPELRFEINNGCTLCKVCHSKTETYCGKINALS